MGDLNNVAPEDWNEWKKLYKNTIRHSQFEWNFAIDVIPEVIGLKPRQVIPQHPFIGRDGREYHMDFAIITEKVKIAIELEGYDKTNSGSGKSKKEHDEFNRRIQHLTRLGWKVLTITNAQFMSDPLGYANEIRQLMVEPQTEVVVVASQDNSETIDLIKKTGTAGLAVIVALIVLLIFVVSNSGSDLNVAPVSNSPIVLPQTFKNCKSLNQVYVNGVARDQVAKNRKTYSNPIVNASVYNANRQLDGNDDGVMCDSK